MVTHLGKEGPRSKSELQVICQRFCKVSAMHRKGPPYRLGWALRIWVFPSPYTERLRTLGNKYVARAPYFFRFVDQQFLNSNNPYWLLSASKDRRESHQCSAYIEYVPFELQYISHCSLGRPKKYLLRAFLKEEWVKDDPKISEFLNLPKTHPKVTSTSNRCFTHSIWGMLATKSVLRFFIRVSDVLLLANF